MERKKIIVRELKPPQEIGTRGAKKVSWKDDDGLEYFTFTARFFEYIIEGQEIDVDIETSQRTYGDRTYTDRKIVELYINNEPAGKKPQSQGWQPRAKDPEERHSIETQVAAKITAELWIAGKLDDDSIEVEFLGYWLMSKLDAPLKTKPVEKPSKPVKKDAPKDKTENEPPITPEQIETLQAYLNRGLGETMADLIKQYGWAVKHKEELTQPQAEKLIGDIEECLRSQERGLAGEAKAAGQRG